MNYDARTAILFANAFELVISLAAAAILLAYVFGRIKGWGDAVRRFCRVMRRDFQGGPYDLAIAIMVIFLGKVVRTEAEWEWRVFGSELSNWRMLFGLVVSAVGTLCMIRILSRADHFNAVWISTAVAALLFAASSVAAVY